MNFGHGYKPSKYGAKKIIYNGEIAQYREHNGKKYRHCYSCHFEFFEEE